MELVWVNAFFEEGMGGWHLFSFVDILEDVI